MADPRSHLLFTLAGPMAAFGDVTVGQLRSTWDRPSKSAVLGLVAAALGIPRAQSADHARLHATLGFAVRVDRLGEAPHDRPAIVLRDYHTAQAPSSGRDRRWATRRDELAEPDRLNTVLSDRWYWAGFAATVALWARSSDAPPLADIAAALDRPAYALYLGRKSCPLSQPPAPRLIDAPSLPAAFAAYDEALKDGARARITAGPVLWADDDHESGAPDQCEVRRDTVVRREAWVFEDRVQHRLLMPSPEASA
ncbi:type I-E CRISPR-associated protein Cas5/CasD [Hankyongella ginsenosidimutans]|uniref:Type I-E CRISPR-associated protein Cas5/CasD n=1 Tax=Hankyongella ginsenosidimutans TaxID=1763828 RepID=A0A4D7BY95_9SPHN|nr:type I-E CRISPR-associated protein Cas5/CasD [Hankyongella ginsenosidimutans]QCI80329.1 type I-E CRISPR-associated protein Cas5/CasD [Hankyongella ginsenosidimutans]